MKKYTFKKEERLCSKRRIESLFHNGSSFIVYPFRAVYQVEPSLPLGSPSVAILISVSKKRFKKAVSRNRIKRLLREAYRLEKSALGSFLGQHSLHLSLAIQYVGTEELPLVILREKMQQLMCRIENGLSKVNMEQAD